MLLQGLRASRRRVTAALLTIAAFPLLLGSVVLTRFDLWPATLALAALAALVWERDRLGFGLLGRGDRGEALPRRPRARSPSSYVWRRRGRREALVCLGVLGGVVLLVFVPFLVLAPDGVAHSIGRQLGRPLQIESLASGVFLVLHQVAGLDIEMRSSHGSQNLEGTGPAVAAILLSLVQLAVIVWIWLRRPGSAEELRALERRRGRRLRRARQGAVAAVPDLARAARPARRGPTRAPRVACSWSSRSS